MARNETSRGAARVSAQPPRAAPAGLAGGFGESGVADVLVRLVATSARDGVSCALRVSTAEASGRVFIADGRIIHAEFGEDYGLRALIEVLRAHRVCLERESGERPSVASLHLGAELLTSLVRHESRHAPQLDTGVVRKVDHGGPPPLPDAVAPAPDPSATRIARSSGVVPRAEATAMVRVSCEGELLAEHGEDTRRLARAALRIHRLARAIGADFGAEVGGTCVCAGERTLLVTRSEVGDIAAALGTRSRLAPLLGKVGLI